MDFSAAAEVTAPTAVPLSLGPKAPPPPVVAPGVFSLPVVQRERYQVTDELARGGMGRILIARDLHLHRPVAIKELIFPTPEAIQRFTREILITARLSHPAIV